VTVLAGKLATFLAGAWNVLLKRQDVYRAFERRSQDQLGLFERLYELSYEELCPGDEGVSDLNEELDKHIQPSDVKLKTKKQLPYALRDAAVATRALEGLLLGLLEKEPGIGKPVVGRLKSSLRIVEKAAARGKWPDVSDVLDMARASLVTASHQGILVAYKTIRDSKEVKILKVKNRFRPDAAKNGWRDVNLILEFTTGSAEGMLAELQLQLKLLHDEENRRGNTTVEFEVEEEEDDDDESMWMQSWRQPVMLIGKPVPIDSENESCQQIHGNNPAAQLDKANELDDSSGEASQVNQPEAARHHGRDPGCIGGGAYANTSRPH
ncbi:unnamed protein product, partial [Symbiodinium sp. CCMP2456]